MTAGPTSWEPRTPVGLAVYAAGFEYDPSQDIIYSRMYAVQRLGGYTWNYDVGAPAVSMIIDCEPIYFKSGGKNWMIELWKGQYGLETGAEIGVYNTYLGHGPPAFYQCATDPEIRLLKLSFTLRRNNKVLFRRGPEHHWWLTGFKWGVFTDDTTKLTMDIAIEFTPSGGKANDEMREAFANALIRLGYRPTVTGRTVHFHFHRPHTQQPPTRWALESPMQSNNRRLVDAYLDLRRQRGVTDNDPNAWTLGPSHDRHVPRHAARHSPQHGAAHGIKHLARPMAKKVVRTVGKAVARAEHRVKHDLGGEISEHEIFALFHDKTWHNTH